MWQIVLAVFFHLKGSLQESMYFIIEFLKTSCIIENIGNSLAVQWLGLGAFTAGAQVQSLAGELRSQKLHGVAKKRKEKKI